MSEKKKKIEVKTECKSGSHVFIVTNYMTKGNYQKATMMRCQYCLMPMNLEEVEMNEWKSSEGMS